MKIENKNYESLKEIFSNSKVVKFFLNRHLPKTIINEIDLNTLILQGDSFICQELKEDFFDRLYRTNIDKKKGYIYLLFQRERYIEEDIFLKLIRHMIKDWKKRILESKIDELPIILPLIIYPFQDKLYIKGQEELNIIFNIFKNRVTENSKYIKKAIIMQADYFKELEDRGEKIESFNDFIESILGS